MSLTVQQQAAVEARGKTIVSAAAGSGKTHVMVSRFVRLILGEHADIRDMLAVTFTNKAAAQMRDRIRRALLEAIANASGETRDFLMQQLKNLPLADICTIHAFCGRLLRTYFYLVDLDPAFRIIGDEDAEGAALSARAMERAFEEAYEGNVAGFDRLLAVYYRKKDDPLKDFVRRLYGAVRVDAHYRDTLAAMASGSEDTFDEAAEVIRTEAVRQLQRIQSELSALGALLPAVADPKFDKYYVSLEETLEGCIRSKDLFDLASRIAQRLEGTLDASYENPVKQDLADRLRDLRSVRLKKVRDSVRAYHVRDEEREKYDNGRQQAAALAALTLVYDDMYIAEKREAGVLDYEDLEHLTIALLRHEEVRDALSKRYRYVFVDEYQDVNPMQEEIVTLLSGEDVFLVGDLKQAIYGFRGSKSAYFAEKERAFAEVGNCLPLSANFRSAQAILDAVNTVFTAALPGYIKLDGGELYGSYRGEVVLHELPPAEQEERPTLGVYSVKEAAARARADRTAERVVAIVEEECGSRTGCGRQYFDTSSGGLREVKYGDIAVLVRKKRETTAAVVRMLSERGIPVTTDAKINICEYFEVRLILDWLSLLDDPEQDIPLASAMLSVIGGFSDGDLARIRLFTDGLGMRGTFRAACLLYAERAEDGIAERLKAFFARVAAYRDLMRVRTASEMIVLLLADGLEAQIAAKGESGLRLGRVRRLIAESGTCGDVHSFLARLRDCGFEVDLSEAGGENAVHIATIHASKGLEFPVVILIDLDTEIRGVFKKDEFLWTDKFHFAPRCYDLENKLRKDTLLRTATALYAMQEAIDGELNLLYVAMTRARCRLHMVFSDGPCKYETAEEEMRAYSVADAKCFADFIPRLSLDAVRGDPAAATAPVAAAVPLYRPDEELVARIRAAAVPYAFAAGTRVPVKDSASGLLGRKRVPMYEEGETEDVDTMSEMSTEDAGMGGGYSVEVGTAYHAFLEHVNFGADAAEELARMREEGLLPPEQLALLDGHRLRGILALPLLRGVAGKRTYREQRFLARFPAREFASSYGVAADDEVMYQGAIDLLVEEGNGRYTVIDYKFSSLPPEQLLLHYAVQLKLYRMTVARVMKCDLACVDVYLVNIARGYEVACPLA